MPDAPSMSTENTKRDAWIIADIGATNSRVALCSVTSPAPRNLRYFKNAEIDSVESLLAQYVRSLDRKPTRAAIAIAAPITGDAVRMINLNWSFSRDALRRALDLDSLHVINDFHAVACALPEVTDESRVEIGSSTQYRRGNIAVLGPGSGLGVAAWITGADGGLAMCGEGGHVSLSARNEKENAIVTHFRNTYGHCSAERVLSGPGIAELHYAIHGERPAKPEDVTANPDDPRCADTLAQFFLFLGNVAADLALTTGALGGLYIAGGIVPSCIEVFGRSGFRKRFEDKNRYRDYMRAIPTWVFTDPTPGLSGLAAYIRSAKAGDD
jgi:glucokinase